jgi:uncharacterized membrane protein
MTGVVRAEREEQRRSTGRPGVVADEPVHPRWTHAPLGGSVLVAVFDVVSAAAGSSRPWARELYRSGTFVLTVMPVLMAMAIATGWVDRARATIARTSVRGRANLHGAVMVVLAVASAADVALRRVVYPDARHTPVGVLALTIAALGAAIVGGNLGGRLTYRAGVGVRHHDPPVSSDAGGPL